MDNQSYQKGWSDLIIKNGNIDSYAKTLGLSAKTLDLYRGFVWNHYKSCLKKMFPRLQDVWDIDWTQVASDYFAMYPPLAWELNDMTVNFPNFLRKTEVPEYLCELAEYEITEFMVYKSKLAKGSSPRPNPTLRTHQFQHNIAGWVKQMDELEAKGDMARVKQSMPGPGVSVVFVALNPETNLCVFTSASLVDIAIYEVFSQVDIAPNNIAPELKMGIDAMLPIEISDKISLEIVEKHLKFLQKQCVII